MYAMSKFLGELKQGIVLHIDRVKVMCSHCFASGDATVRSVIMPAIAFVRISRGISLNSLRITSSHMA